MGETIEKQPTSVIECPNGEVIRIYQEVSPKYLKELIAVFTEKE
jgi:hypothetical protein